MADEGEIKVNRAPVLTLWAAVVAERLGHDPDTAITLGRAVAARLGVPITATSANLAGHPECTDAHAVLAQLGEKIPLIVDGGPTARAIPTTIVDLSQGDAAWSILREGAIPTHEIALCLQR